jgi:hypothetical protein
LGKVVGPQQVHQVDRRPAVGGDGCYEVCFADEIGPESSEPMGRAAKVGRVNDDGRTVQHRRDVQFVCYDGV